MDEYIYDVHACACINRGLNRKKIVLFGFGMSRCFMPCRGFGVVYIHCNTTKDFLTEKLIIGNVINMNNEYEV